ncbi:MAG: hypothetical protein ACMUIP_08185 [bacterium]
METRIGKMNILLFLTLLVGILLLFLSRAQAQNWVELPPYNTLWPLWSPALSPIDDATGLPTPIVTSLEPDISLPLAPGLTWDPALPYPWLLYNTFSGLAYFDPLAGMNLWPAPSLLDSVGNPAPLELPLGYADLPPTDGIWLANNVPTANLYYRLYFPAIPLAAPIAPSTGPTNTILASLLTPLDILGPTLGVPSILSPTLPLLQSSVPTAIAPLPTVPIPAAPVPTGAISGLFIAEQVGSWTGSWISLVKTQAGPLELDLVENLETGLSGTAFMIGYNNILEPFNVAGPLPNGAFFLLNGSYINPTTGVSYDIELECTLVSDIRIEGNYFIEKVGATKVDYGEITLNLVAPVLTVPAPTATPVVPAPTPVIPIATVPAAPTPVVLPATIAAPAPVPITSTIPVVPLVTAPLPVPPTAAVSGLWWLF